MESGVRVALGPEGTMVATRRRTTSSHPIVVDGATVHRRRCRGGFARDDGGERVTRRHDRDWRTTDPTHAIWSGSEPVGRTDCPPASPVSGRRRLLARPGAPATLPARRTSTTAGRTDHPTLGRSQANPQPSVPAEWSGRESAGRTASQHAGPVRGCLLWAGRFPTVARQVICEHVTTSTRTGGGAA